MRKPAGPPPASKKTESSDVDHDALASLADAVDQVQDDLTCIRHVVDEIHDDIGWLAKNQHGEQWVPIQPLTSMPLDPLAFDWPARLNRITAADLAERKQPQPPSSHAIAGDAKQASEDAEALMYCCEEPNLKWTGDPDFPGVGCVNCGYIVAESGSVVMASPPEVHGCEVPPEDAGPAQKELF